MSLDRSKLRKVRELGNGGWQAQCPACAEAGQDRTGEHLRVSADGKFGCCVFPGDREHRKRIFALAGEDLGIGYQGIKVRVVTAKPDSPLRQNLLGRLGRLFGSQMEGQEGTAMNVGTLGTGTYSLRVEEKGETDQLYIRKLIEYEEPVPSVPEKEQLPDLGSGVPGVPGNDGTNGKPRTVRLPYLLADGSVVIPFDSPERYHWWKGGQSVRRTVAELLERKELDASPF